MPRIDAKAEKCLEKDSDRERVGMPRSTEASNTNFSSAPQPVMLLRTKSPGFRSTGGLWPTPAPGGVPVKIRSPGSSVQ